jgi:integrase
MGSITPYDTAQGKRYRVRYRKPDHSQTDKRGFTTKRDAELFLATIEVKKATGQYIDTSAAKITIGDLAKDWLAGKQAALKPSSYNALAIAWRIHVEPRWARRQIGSIRHTEIQAWLTELASSRSATVTIRAHGVLAGTLDTALKDRRIPSNPARDVDLPRKRSKRRQYLTHRQVAALAEESRQHKTLVLLLAYTGLRWGEAVALRIHSLDMLRSRILVQANAPFVGGKIVPGTPKTHEKRSVPFPNFLSIALTEQCKGKDCDALVFGNADYLHPPTHGNGWFFYAKKRVCKIDKSFPENLTLHDLRHTAASLAISSGANVKAIQRMLGHASAAMTLDTYADLFDEDLDAVAVALDNARNESFVGKTWANRISTGTPTPELPRKHAGKEPWPNVPLEGVEPPTLSLGRKRISPSQSSIFLISS